MSDETKTEEKPKNTAKDNAKAAIDAGYVEMLKDGERRQKTVTYPKGRKLSFNGGYTMVTKSRIIIDVDEIYENNRWRIKAWYLDSIRPAPPGLWQRFWDFIFRRKQHALPPATVVKS